MKNRQIEEKKQELEQTLNQINLQNQSNEKLKRVINELQNENNAFQETLNQLNAQNKKFEIIFNSQTEQIQQYEKEVYEGKQNYQKQLNEMKSNQQQLEKENVLQKQEITTKLNLKIEDLQNLLETERSKVQSLYQQNLKTEIKLEQILSDQKFNQDDLQNQKEANDNLKKNFKQIACKNEELSLKNQQFQDQIIKLQDQNYNLQLKLEDSQTQTKKQSAFSQNITKEYDQLKTKCKELEQLTQQYTSRFELLSEQTSELQNRYENDLQQSQQIQNSQKQEISRIGQSVNEWKKKCQEAWDELSRTKENEQMLESDRNKLETQIKSLEDKTLLIVKENEKLSHIIETKLEQISQLQHKNQNSKLQQETSQKVLVLLSIENQRIHEIMQKTEIENQQLSEDIQEVKLRLLGVDEQSSLDTSANIKDIMDKIENYLDSKDKTISEQQEKLYRMKNENQALNENSKEFQVLIKEKESLHQNYLKLYKDTELLKHKLNDYDSKTMEIEILKKQLKASQKQLSNLSTINQSLFQNQ